MPEQSASGAVVYFLFWMLVRSECVECLFSGYTGLFSNHFIFFHCLKAPSTSDETRSEEGNASVCFSDVYERPPILPQACTDRIAARVLVD